MVKQQRKPQSPYDLERIAEEKDLKCLQKDIWWFINLHKNENMSNKMLAQMFCERWAGYKKKYGEIFVENIIKRTRF
jgi:hypothetical protein